MYPQRSANHLHFLNLHLEPNQRWKFDWPSFAHCRDIRPYIWPVREKTKIGFKISKSQHRKNQREFFLCSDLANFVVSNKVDDEEFESEEKTGNGSSFVRHFDENPSKIAGNRSANSGGLGDAPRSPVRLRIRRVFLFKHVVCSVSAVSDAGQYNCSFAFGTQCGRQTFIESIDVTGRSLLFLVSWYPLCT